MRTRYEVSERRACLVLRFARSSHRYQSVREDPVALRMRLRELAAARPRFGYRRLWLLLRREGWAVNHKLVYRLYVEEGLQVRSKRRKKRAAQRRVAPPAPSGLNQRWGIDFVSDATAQGRRLRVFAAIDVFSRECLALHVAPSIRSIDVTRALDAVIARRGARSRSSATTAASFPATTSTSGHTREGCTSTSFGPASRSRMRTSNPSTGGCATSASTHTGLRGLTTRGGRSRIGGATTTRPGLTHPWGTGRQRHSSLSCWA